ncbi:MAG: LptF/LptG family permease [Verrucomicrobiota bacterium]
MRLHDRYLLRELLIPLGYCLSGFLIFWIAADLFNELPAFQEAKLRGWEVAEHYLLRMPELLGTVLPMSLLLAMLYALTAHTRHNELVALRAAGVSIWRLAAPYYVVGILGSIFLFLLADVWMADSADAADAIKKRHQRVAEEDRDWVRNLNFHNDVAGRTWTIGRYNIHTSEVQNLQVEWKLANGSSKLLDAERAEWRDKVWTLYSVWEIQRPAGAALPEQIQHAVLPVPQLTETPAQIKSEIKISGTTSLKAAKKIRFSLREILDYLKLHSSLPRDKEAMLYTQLHGRLAGPWKCLVVVLVAIPFGAASGRRNALVGVAASIFIGFAYFIVSQFGLALGTSGHVPALLAAWLPNVLFGVGGLVLTWRMR